jgi:hypothetical protein
MYEELTMERAFGKPENMIAYVSVRRLDREIKELEAKLISHRERRSEIIHKVLKKEQAEWEWRAMHHYFRSSTFGFLPNEYSLTTASLCINPRAVIDIANVDKNDTKYPKMPKDKKY